jgi:hypothetical protein
MINPIYDLYLIPHPLGSKWVSRLFTVLSVFLLTVLLLHGCTGKVVKDSTPNQPTDKVVWADDGSEVAVVTFSKNSTNSDSSNFRHKILAQNLDGSKQRTITQWRDYRVGQIFYMKQAGYLVVESLLENGGRRFDQVSLDGSEIMILETPDNGLQGCSDSESTGTDSRLSAQLPHSVIPSPDGSRLAHIYSPECGKVAIEFFYANNLVLIDTKVMDIDEQMMATWHPDSGNYAVILANKNNDKAWKITTSAPPEPITPPKCLSPVTTSSEVSLEGKKVYFEGDKLVTKDVGREKAFGCQY